MQTKRAAMPAVITLTLSLWIPMSAQTTIGLPEHGVLLTSLSAAGVTIENQTDRKIVVTILRLQTLKDGAYADRKISVNNALISIRDGSTRDRRSVPPHSSVVLAHEASDGDPATLARVILDGVMFEDGELVGPDAGKSFDFVKLWCDRQRALYAGTVEAHRRGGLSAFRSQLEEVKAGRGQQLSGNPLVDSLMEDYARELLGVWSTRGPEDMAKLARRGMDTIPANVRRGQGAIR